ncbi:hypothetical protein Trydic_g20713 [Trypoxylus dichotomus]
MSRTRDTARVALPLASLRLNGAGLFVARHGAPLSEGQGLAGCENHLGDNRIQSEWFPIPEDREDNPNESPAPPKALPNRKDYGVDQVSRRKKAWSGNLNVCWSNRGDGRQKNQHLILEKMKDHMDELLKSPEALSNRTDNRMGKLTLRKKR